MIKQILLVLIIGLLSAACAPQVNLENEKADVRQVLEKFIKATESEDIEMLSEVYANDETMINFGTDSGERIVGWDALKSVMEEQFAATDSSSLSVSMLDIKVSSTGKTAWFSEIVDWSLKAGDEAVDLKGLRASGVLEKLEGSWKIVQVHYSIPSS